MWYIYKQYKKDIDPLLSALRVDIQAICDMAKRLKDIRDTVIFHIDKKGVLNPEDEWNKANIKGDQLAAIMDALWEVLLHVYKLHFGKEVLLPEYTGEDATKIIKLLRKRDLFLEASANMLQKTGANAIRLTLQHERYLSSRNRKVLS